LILVGALLAAVSAVLAFARTTVGEGAVHALIAVVLSLVAVGVLRGVRWIVALVVLVFAGQITAVAGTALELVYGVAPGKAAQLRALGFRPALGVGINLAYSALAFGWLCWFLTRWYRLRDAAKAGARP
jgi:hypothetical protein